MTDSKSKNSVRGRWKNQLGSEVEFEVNNGQLTGYYWTEVSSTGKSLPAKKLEGTTQTTPDGTVLASWSVQWKVETPQETRYSTTSWAGILRDGKLKTSWILVCANEPEWKSTNIGFDEFTLV